MEVNFFIKRSLFETVNGKRTAVDQFFQSVGEDFFEYFISRLHEDVYDKCVSCVFSSCNVDVVLDLDKYFRSLDITFIKDHADSNYQSNI